MRRLEHIGSTSVPGLAGKPLIDTHLHVYASGRAEERDYLDLQDWLRVSSDDRTPYANVKRHLAQKKWHAMNDHTDAKTDVVLDILAGARACRAASTRPDEAYSFPVRRQH